MRVDVNELLMGLDAQQRDAVTCPPSATVVHAGAGSGKTRVLTHRIAYRVLTGRALPENILAITFTREAAGEMRRRLHGLGVGARGTMGPTVGTFHAVALALLRQRLTDLGQLVPNIVHNRNALATSAAGAHFLAQRPRDLLMEIDWAHARMIEPADYAAAVKRNQRSVPAPAADIAEMFKQYEALKKKRQVVDLDDLLARVVADMNDDAAYAEVVRWRFRHIFVDEAQDMNPLQYALFTAIRGGRPDVFVVGDPLQAIYGWNGADRMLFDTLPEQLGQTTMLKLPNNYRCTPHIVHAARHAARQSGEPVDIVAVREDGPPVHMVGFDTAEKEAAGIAQLLWKYAPTAGADPWSSVAVLVRTNNQVAAIAKELKKAGIPLGSSKQSADITAAIELAAQCGSRNALATWAADTMAESLDDAEREVAAMVFEFLHLDQPGVVDGRAFTAWTTANHIAKAADSGVDLLTFHGAKGREWNCVVVAGAESGLLPHGSANTADQKKEEIRLAYVALTRAANQLYVTYAEKRGSRNAGLSPLLEGLPKRAPSPEELAREEAAVAIRAAMPRTNSGQPTVLDKLTTWRRHLARSSNLTPQEICTDADLLELSSMTPTGVADFAPIFGDMTAQRVGPALLEILAINSGLIDTNIA